MTKQFRIAHTEDADDAFMFYALTAKKVHSSEFELEHVLRPIQELNQAAKQGLYEMSALSFAAYPAVADKYALMPCGACMGFKHGPMLLSRQKLSLGDIDRVTVAIPGRLTTAFLVLQMISPGVRTIDLPFDQIVAAVKGGEVEAGLIIHEAQLNYERTGLNKVVDLGEWWFEQTGLPLPLGGNVIRKNLGQDIMAMTKLFQDSIRYAIANRTEAANFATRYARGLSVEEATRFIGLYVNELTIEYGETGKRALRELFARAYEAKALAHPVEMEFVVQ
jgi:1,4-dihydroxy-6-naphthoate synthase